MCPVPFPTHSNPKITSGKGQITLNGTGFLDECKTTGRQTHASNALNKLLSHIQHIIQMCHDKSATLMAHKNLM